MRYVIFWSRANACSNSFWAFSTWLGDEKLYGLATNLVTLVQALVTEALRCGIAAEREDPLFQSMRSSGFDMVQNSNAFFVALRLQATSKASRPDPDSSGLKI